VILTRTLKKKKKKARRKFKYTCKYITFGAEVVLTINIIDTYNLEIFRPFLKINTCYPLANEVAKGYSNASVRPSFSNILVNTLESTSFNGF
jgi:hypothetical protein